MKKIKRIKLILIAVLLGASAIMVFYLSPLSTHDAYADAKKEISECEKNETVDQVIDCWYEIVRGAYKEESIEKAFAIFKLLYENSDIFIRTGCHRHAHRIGDTAYYESYLAHKDITKMDFPQIASVCGYGFFHGFIEHLVQDRPDPDFVRKTCAYLDKRYTSIMPDIRMTCFHGSGHGYSISAVDHAGTSNWGKPNDLVGDSLSLCEATATSVGEIEECKEGVFNVVVEWMADKEYGLAYDYNDPFWLCREQEDSNQQACYYEMSQKMDAVTGYDVLLAADIATNIENKKYSEMVFSVALAGFMQSKITEDKQYDYIKDCRNVPEALRPSCIQSIVSGLFEHGNPGEEHVKAFKLCGWGELSDQEKDVCYQASIGKLARFHSKEEIANICTQYEGLAQFCMKSGIL